jgi:hypothetical protein
MAGSSDSGYTRWRALAVDRGILVPRDSLEQAQPRASVPTHAAGVSLRFVQGLAATVEHALSLEPSGGRTLSTREWVASITPRTGGLKGAH